MHASHQNRTTLSGFCSLICVVATLIGTINIASADLADGLVSYYTFDDGSGDTLKEITGNGTDGELFEFPDDDTQWVAGQIGGALQFDGIDDYVIAPSYSLAETGLSVSIWAWAESAPTWGSLVKNWGGSIVGQFHFGLGPGADDTLNIFVTTTSEGAFNAGTDADDIPLEEWQHLAFVANPDEGTVTLYRNGQDVDERPYDGTFTDSPISEALGIGVKTNDDGDAADVGNPGYWDGLLDDLGIWTRALTVAEIQQIYNGGLAGNGLLGGNVRGDFDGNGMLDAADIDLLSQQVRDGNHSATFDLTGDGLVDRADRFEWVEKLKNTYFGDSTLDGEFNTTDFVLVFQLGEYEDAVAGNSTWGEGDWDGSTDFDSSDFVIAFQGGGFEQGPRPDVVAVPEPSGFAFGLVACLLLMRRPAQAGLI